MWVATAGLLVFFGLLALVGIGAAIPTAVIVGVILVIAAPRRVRDLGAEELRNSRPDE